MKIREAVSETIIIEKSKFISFIYPCDNVEQYRNFLDELKVKYYDSTHVCSAYIINNSQHHNDDGEPQGSAGLPILSTLNKYQLEDCCGIVVRYFGGIKLGIGGLIRAYSTAIEEAMKKATLLQAQKLFLFKVALDYNQAFKLRSILENYAYSFEEIYHENVEYRFFLKEQTLSENILNICKETPPQFIKEETIYLPVK